ncbi:Hypothetical protein NocV09_00501550 [Nannochloropsis oceanica]
MSLRAAATPKQSFDRQRDRLLIRENFAKAVAQDTQAFRKTEWEVRTDALAVSRHEQRQRQQAAAQALAAEAKVAQLLKDQQCRETAKKNALSQQGEVGRTTSRLRPRTDPATLKARKAALQEQAYALQARNEAARRALVQSCLDRQWRDGCDSARLLDSQALQRVMTEAQQQQLIEKQVRQDQVAKHDTAFHANIRRHVEELDEAESHKQALQAQRKRETVVTLETQIALGQAEQQKAKAAQAAEDAEELAQIAADLKRNEEQATARRDAAWARGQDVREFNDRRLEQVRARAEEERQRDLALLEHAMALEAKEVAREKAKDTRAHLEARIYRQYLEEVMKKESEDERAVDAVRQAKEDEVWEQREAMFQARKKKHERLWQQVDAGRQEQLRYKALAGERVAEEAAREVEKWKLEQAAGMEEERRAQEAHRAAVKENQEMLQQQVESRQRRERWEQQQEYLRTKHMQKEEAALMQRQKSQAGIARTYFPLRLEKWID